MQKFTGGTSRPAFSRPKKLNAKPAKKRSKLFSTAAPGETKKKKSSSKKKAFAADSGAKVNVQFESDEELQERIFQKLSDAELAYRRERMDQLVERMHAATDLPLQSFLHADNLLVPGRGPLSVKLMIIGEAPGAEEARTGRPFVGPSGQLLAEMLQSIQLNSEEHVYITNTICVRPPNNRDPTWEELSDYAHFVEEQIEIVQPSVILCLGRIASSLVANGFSSLQALRGARLDSGAHSVKTLNFETIYRNKSNVGVLTLRRQKLIARYYTSYHPSFLLRQKEVLREESKYWTRWQEDFRTLRGMLDEPRVEFIDAEAIVRDTAPPGFAYAQPGQQFYTSPHALSPEQTASWSAAEQGLEFELHRTEYREAENRYAMFGRTADDHSVCVEVLQPEFAFYVTHPAVYRGLVSQVELEHLERDVQSMLREEALKRQKYRNLLDLASTTITLSLSQNQNYIGYRPGTKPFLRVVYREYDLRYALKGILEKTFERFEPRKAIKFLESSLSPTDQLYLARGIYVRGWTRIAAPTESSLRFKAGPRISRSELEYSVNYADLTGFSPNPGEAGDAKWEKQGPTRVVALDAEMLNTGGMFPTPQQDPIVSICAVTQTYDKAGRSNWTEKVRSAAAGKDREVRSTGRSNTDNAVVFCVGSLASIPSSEFKRTSLPNIPLAPDKFELTWTTGGRAAGGKYAHTYAVSIRKWNDFIERFAAWQRHVGVRRAQNVVRSRQLYTVLSRLSVRPGGADPKKEWADEALVLQWEADVATVIRLFTHTVSKKDIATISEPAAWQTDYAALPSQAEKELQFGEIQARWTQFRPPAKVFSFSTEQDMLRGFYTFLHQYDPDLITGYNSNNFDLSYFIQRVRVLDLRDPATGKLISMGRLRDEEDQDIVKTSFSKATGDRSFHTIRVPGRDCYDLLNYVMRDVKLQSYTLASVAQAFLKDSKNDVPYSAIPSLFRNNRERLNAYCLKDAELVLMLMNDMNNMNYLISLARLIGQLNIERLYVDGKQAQVFAVLIRYLRRQGRGKIIPDKNIYSKEEGDIPETYAGAHVFDPATKGLFLLLLLCLDYNSLYPTIMLALNLGHDVMGTLKRMLKYGVPLEQCYKTDRTFINPKTKEPEHYYFRQPTKRTREQAAEEGLREDECNVLPSQTKFRKLNPTKGVTPESVLAEAGAPGTASINTYVFQDAAGARFKRTLDQLVEGELSVADAVGCLVTTVELWSSKNEDAALCASERLMLAARARVKNLMKPLHPSSDEYRRLDMIQMALKIICNSMYGATGVKSGRLAGLPISDSVTSHGRKTILGLAKKLTKRYNADVQGGDTDSVFVHFPHITKLEHIYEKVSMTDPDTGDVSVQTRVQEILKFANSLVPHPMKIDFEKAYSMMFAIAKKRAACREHMPIWDSNEQCMRFEGNGKLTYKGLETKRRDSCLIAQEIFGGFLERVFTPNSTPAANYTLAAEYVRGETAKVLQGQVRFHELIQARQLSKKNYNSKVPHVELCKKFRRRGQPVPELGSRIPFVVVTGRKTRKFADSVEDPDYAMAHNLLPDYKYIVDKKIRKPIERFTACMPAGEQYNRRMFGGFSKVQRENILEDDPILRHIVRSVPCMACGKPARAPVCDSCSGTVDWRALWQSQQERLQAEEGEYARTLAHCRKCVGIGDGEQVDCVNTSCADYFPRRRAEYTIVRTKAQMDDCWKWMQTAEQALPADFDW